ncbi:MAG: hypothetical protein FWE35_07040 [Streptosporangiales bacterium]|nr:hypothetical protein [Streptosporangiales bacterium]
MPEGEARIARTRPAARASFPGPARPGTHRTRPAARSRVCCPAAAQQWP